MQALHPFYNRTGDVIACWMTRLQTASRRSLDNVRYVASVVAEVKRELPVSERLVYLGFSQGAAMAYRAAAGSGHACTGVVVLGGDVPPELDSGISAGFLPSCWAAAPARSGTTPPRWSTTWSFCGE